MSGETDPKKSGVATEDSFLVTIEDDFHHVLDSFSTLEQAIFAACRFSDFHDLRCKVLQVVEVVHPCNLEEFA